jgi:hypothetical protein
MSLSLSVFFWIQLRFTLYYQKGTQKRELISFQDPVYVFSFGLSSPGEPYSLMEMSLLTNHGVRRPVVASVAVGANGDWTANCVRAFERRNHSISES